MTIALHTPCWAQAFRPGVTGAMLALGQRLGLDLAVPGGQTCCGLPAWDAGQEGAARAAARQTLHLFEGYELVLTPSASCLRMLRQHLSTLLTTEEAQAALALADRCQSWAAYVDAVSGAGRLGVRFEGAVAYFVPCSQETPDTALRLLASVRGARLLPLTTGACCGFGANLSWRHPDLSRAMGMTVVTALRLSRADVIVTDDLGCLLHLAPLLAEMEAPPIRHLAEFLAEHVSP